MTSPFDTDLPAPPQRLAAPLSPFLTRCETPGKGAFFAVSLEGLARLADLEAVPPRQAMLSCLDHGIWPLRFKNNRGLLSATEQARLLRSHAAVIGCGGLGGYVISLLARLGIGEMTLCDNDIFEESNLNRQLFCREDRLGENKAVAAGKELALMASHVLTHVHEVPADARSLPALLKEADVAVDCLDGISARRELEQAARARGIPFVHGAIGGLEGFAASGPPAGPSVITSLYGLNDVPKEKRAEAALGVPTPTPAGIAVLQTVLVLRALLGRDSGDGALWHLDLSAPLLEILRLR